jgi:anti-sigma regulatory factor (Ser/Thr protein kinase)
MTMLDQFTLSVTETSQVAESRRLALEVARGLGFEEPELSKVALLVTELATNLIKHAHGGELLLGSRQGERGPGMEILALDQGPGMAQVRDCLRDGYSTAGSPGTGLGAVTRHSDLFDIYSKPGAGTAVLAHLWAKETWRRRENGRTSEHVGQREEDRLDLALPLAAGNRPCSHSTADALVIGSVSVPKPSEEVCGDAWAAEQHGRRTLILVADGLGHGQGAAEASRGAARAFQENLALAPAPMIEVIHTRLRSTRGAALAVAEVDRDRREVRFSGVGNIAGTILSPEGSRKMASYNGTVGHEVRKIQEFNYPWPQNAVLVLHSDGLATHWNLDPYGGLALRHPSLIAGVLYRDFNRRHDDVTVVVAKETL